MQLGYYIDVYGFLFYTSQAAFYITMQIQTKHILVYTHNNFLTYISYMNNNQSESSLRI